MKSVNIAGRWSFLALLFAVLTIPLSTGHAQCTRCCASCPPPPPADILYSFPGDPDGAWPVAGLVRDSAGNLYGTTGIGGTTGNGTVFKVDASGHESVLYSFSGGPDGANPLSSLVLDSNGNLYGTTNAGGAYNMGTVFKLDTTGQQTVLHSFGSGTDGFGVTDPLVLDSAGSLYGTTTSGGTSDGGTVFKVDPSGKETLVHSFTGFPDGVNPAAGLVLDSAGNLYGTAEGGPTAFGVVFKVDASGNETVLYSFKGYPNDGAYPQMGLIRDASGNLYGMTSGGGNGSCVSTSNQPVGCGIVFKLDSSGKETVLYNFPNGGAVNGIAQAPQGGLLQDSAGLLYGMTQIGGASGVGLVFQLDTAGHEVDLYSFTDKNGDGGYPRATLISDNAGNLLGTTSGGGAFLGGTVFKLPIPDFSLAPASTSLRLQFGGQATDVLTVADQNSTFNNPIQLTCSVTGPSPVATCSLSPTSVTPGAGSVTSTLTITAPSAATAMVGSARYYAWSSCAMGFPLAAFALILIGRPERERLRYSVLCGSLALVVMLSECGGGGPVNKGPLNYTVTVTATAGPTQHTTQVSVTVQ